MKPYEIINCLLQTIINECYPGEIEYYIFEDNVRWDDSPDIFGPSATNRVGYGNLKRAKFIDELTYYDYHNKSWRNANDMSRIYPSVIDHSFEPIHYDMDIKLWDRKYKKYHPWPIDCLKIKDFPLIVLHSEYGSKDIKKLNNLGYLDVHWFAHAYLCSEFYFKHYHKLEIVQNYVFRPIKHEWICANRLLRQHRTDFLEMLNLDRGCYSLLNPDPNGLTYSGPVTSCSLDDHTNSSDEIFVNWITPWNTRFLHVVS